MRTEILDILGHVTDEERSILNGERFKAEKYFESGDVIVSDASLFGKEVEIGIRRHTRYARFPSHRHSYVEMMIVLRGSIEHTVDGEKIILGAGDILFLNKHVTHSIAATDTEDIGVNIILSDGFVATVTPALAGSVFAALIKENAKPDGQGAYLHFSAAGNRAVENLTENIILELIGEHGDIIAAKTVEILLSYISRESDSLLVAGGVPADKQTVRMNEITAYIEANCTSASLTELARRLYLCTPYLSKVIRTYFGKSFKELVVDERMRRAHTLISQTDMHIGDIIRSVGYENESYFHREFKSRYNATPLAIRKLSQMQKAQNVKLNCQKSE